MITRRTAVAGGAAASVLARTGLALGRAAQPKTPVNFKMPANACDCHTHIHLDPADVPFFEGRVYTPETARPDEMAALHKALGIRRVVIVTPSVYGADNRATVAGIKARGKNARGVAVIDDKTTPRQIDALANDGFTGIRLNLATGGVNDPAVGRERFNTGLRRVRRLGWHVQLYTNLAMISAIKDLVETSPVPVVFDHFGGAQAQLGVDQPGFADLLHLVKTGKAYVKISGAYRSSTQAPDYPDVVPLAKALIAANAKRIVWGSDWPHPDSKPLPGKSKTEVTPLWQIDDGRLLNQLAVWAPDAATRRLILVENPERLYGF
jgi:predicted TIM-barrel fold metal-dependent hydrolase